MVLPQKSDLTINSATSLMSHIADWLQANGLTPEALANGGYKTHLPEVHMVGIEAASPFESFAPMEVVCGVRFALTMDSVTPFDSFAPMEVVCGVRFALAMDSASTLMAS
jgi:hypothetical protein